MGGRMTGFQRLIGIVVSPSQTFADIDRRPTWILPVILMLLSNFAVTFVVYRVLVTDSNFNQIAETRLHWDADSSGKPMSSASVKLQTESLRRQRERWYLLPPYAVFVSTLGMSGFFYLVLRITRTDISLKKVFVVVCWSFVIYRVVGGVFVIAALLMRGPANFFPAAPESWSPTSLAHLISRATVSPNVYSAVSKLDVFLVWWLAVMAVGFAKTAKNLTILKSAIIVTVCEVVCLILNAAGTLPGIS